nr:hypothetical protein [Tanacetum cinerariifolium]
MTRITNSTSVTKPSQTTNLKFLYSYNGTIMPRHTNGKLRYIGGHTRVLSVNRSVTFSELSVKFFEACGFSVKLKCKLPTEDLDVLVTVECDEDLKAVVAEYDRVLPEKKIRCVCFPVKAVKTVSPVPSVESLVEYAAVKRPARFPVVAGGCRGGLPVARGLGFRNPRLSYYVNRW